MKKILMMTICMALLLSVSAKKTEKKEQVMKEKNTKTVLSYTMPLIDGTQQDLSEYLGKVVLIVNTASKCGFTPQFEGLEKLYQQYGKEGFVVLGFPCNQFADQDKGSNKEIASFCQMNYGVTFPMFEKIEVNGDNAAPLYKELKKEAPGLLGSEKIKWNFTKFLINKKGEVIKRYGSSKKPAKLESIIKDELAK